MKKTITQKIAVRILFLLLLIGSGIANVSAQCAGSFTWMQTANNTISFTNTSTGTTSAAHYFWNFGDGTYANSMNAVHFYSTPGTYTACMAFNDTLCSDSVCYSVTVTGITCTLAATASSTDASCPTCADGSATCTATGGTPPYFYSWNGISATTATVSNLTPGNYSVCVTDTSGCIQCVNATVGYTASSCSASFYLFPDSLIPHMYYGYNNSTGVAPLSCFWSWGDGTSDSSNYPTHTYANAGIYTICLTIYDNSGCSSTYCDSMNLMRTSNSMITVSILPSSTTGIKGVDKNSILNIHPNPAKDIAFVGDANSSDKLSSVTIFDAVGKVVGIQELHNNHFDVSSIPPGVYYTNILHSNGKLSSAKLVIVR